MIIYITPESRRRHIGHLRQYFALRKRIFCDKLGWVEASHEDYEIDRFDHLFNVYILSIDGDTGLVAGGVRLMPTTGPTLLHTVWADMVPPGRDFRSDGIWEATRFCVDETMSSRKSNLLNRATLELSIAVADFGNANGISHVVAVCERYFFDMAGVYGPQAEMLSTRLDENGLEIGCGVWSTAAISAKLTWSRAFIGNDEPAIIQKVA